MSDREYMGCAESAKLVRQALKESFPGVKFSVRSHVYSGGASINVSYEDGPAPKLVEAVVGPFKGSYFDGMIDYQGSVYAKLDGKPVRFGADFIFVERKSSDAQIARAIEFIKAKYPNNEVSGSVEDFKAGRLYNVFPLGGSFSGNNSLQCMLNVVLSKLSSVAEPAKSATLARISAAGDDGYGRGTVGLPGGDGGEQCYKAQLAAQERQIQADASADEAEKARQLVKAKEAMQRIALLFAPVAGGVQ